MVRKGRNGEGLSRRQFFRQRGKDRLILRAQCTAPSPVGRLARDRHGARKSAPPAFPLRASGRHDRRAASWPDVSARSTRGEVHDDIPLQPKNHTWFAVDKGRAFAGTMGRVAVSSTVVLRSFSGKIHLRKRPENK